MLHSRRQNLAPLLHPASVAIVGISQLPRYGGWLYQNLRTIGYRGAIYGVNPRYSSLDGQPCYPSINDLPEIPECAILATPNDRLLGALQEAAAIGVRAAIIPASAYSPPVDGQPGLQEQLAAVAREYRMAICGPNCMGLITFGRQFCASGYPIEPGVPAGNVTCIAHSGTVFDTIWQNRCGVRFNYLVSPGNEIVTSMADYMQHALDDPSTRAIGLFLETVRDPATFRAALAEAAARDVPVVALKVGRSERGARLAQAHSGAIAGQDAAYDALFAHYGVRRVATLDEMLNTLQLFAAGIRPLTGGIASIHDSGGERGLLVDLAEQTGVSFAQISQATADKLATIVEPGLPPVNPLDAWGTGNDFGRIFIDALLTLDADPATGLNVWTADLYAAGTVSAAYCELAIAHKPLFSKPLAFLSNVASAVSLPLAEQLRTAGIPVLLGTDSGLRAIGHAIEYARFQRKRAVHQAEPPPVQLTREHIEALRRELQSAPGALGEYASAAFLQAYGIPVAEQGLAETCEEALDAARRIGYPVALKTAAGALHKSDQGGVYLHLADDTALAQAYSALAKSFGARVLVQRMAPPGVELILGLVRDAQFGPLLTIGLGGIFVELLTDVRLLLLPTTRDEVRAALLGLKGAALLQGVRGRPPADLEAIADAALRLAALAHDLGDLVDALDINPLIALPSGAVAVDALIVPCATEGLENQESRTEN